MFKSILFLVLAYTLLLVFAPIVFIIQTINTFAKGVKDSGIKKAWSDTADYFYIVAVDGLDQLGATILYKVRDLTVSSYTFVLCEQGRVCWFKKFINVLFGKKHCEISAKNELDEMENKIKVLKKVLHTKQD